MRCTLLALAVVFAHGLVGCGGDPRWEPTAEQTKAMNKSWAYDREATEKLRNEMVKDATGITADVELKGDVGAFADALSATSLYFSQDKDSGKPGWWRTTGSGLLKSETSGWMEWQGDKKFVLKEFTTDGDKKVDATYEIKELSDAKLVLHKSGETVPDVYKVQ